MLATSQEKVSSDTGNPNRFKQNHLQKLATILTFRVQQVRIYMSGFMRKPAFCICKNEGDDQLSGYCIADQDLCFCYKVISQKF